MFILTMPWPALKPLSPNWRGHWAKKAAAKRAFRSVWWAEALHQGARKMDAQAAKVTLVFHPPNRRRMDLDNMLAATKSGLDGLADAIGIDDSKWSLAISKSAQLGGFVRVTVEPA